MMLVYGFRLAFYEIRYMLLSKRIVYKLALVLIQAQLSGPGWYARPISRTLSVALALVVVHIKRLVHFGG